MRLTVDVAIERWRLAQAFVIARGAKTEAVVVVASVGNGRHVGRGECVPYSRYGETPDAVAEAIKMAAAALSDDTSAAELRPYFARAMPAGAARNALDCALWDYEAKLAGTTVAALAGIPDPSPPIVTAYTLSLDTPDAMAAKAASVANLPLLKLKLGGAGDAERLRAVRAARPEARLIADANEAWTDDLLVPLMSVCGETRVELIEQPLPAGQDGALARIDRIVPVCADESLHTRADLPALADRYDVVNIKLDKTGGLTEALALAAAARSAGFGIMVGSMVSTSLAVAPALLLAQSANARWVDLDGPLLLARDRAEGLTMTNGVIAPATRRLWGSWVPPIAYINTDLDLVSAHDLTELGATLTEMGWIELHLGKIGEEWRASFEISCRETTPEATISAMLDAIERLDAGHKAAFDACRVRDFNIGFASGEAPRCREYVLGGAVLARVARAGARVGMTLYASDNTP